MAAMAVSRPPAVQWREEPLGGARRRRTTVSVAPVRALKDSEHGGRAGRSGRVELSRRALIALVVLSSQLSGVAAARNISGADFLPCVLVFVFVAISMAIV
jgi:hypothetical protein